MIYRALFALALVASASAAPARHALSVHPREARVAKLQAVNPGATKEACEGCVSAEDELIAKLGDEEKATQAEVDAAEAHAAAAKAHADAVTALAANDGDVADKKAAVQAVVTGDQGDLDVDSPDGIIGSTGDLKTKAEAWKNAIAARGEQQTVVDGLKKERDAAEAAERAAEGELFVAKVAVGAARTAADAACSAMRGAGYGAHVAPATTAPSALPAWAADDCGKWLAPADYSKVDVADGAKCYASTGVCLKDACQCCSYRSVESGQGLCAGVGCVVCCNDPHDDPMFGVSRA